MGRTSKLNEKQWAEIEKLLLDGVSGRSLAEKYGVSEAAIRKRLGAQTRKIKDVANQLVTAELAYDALPIGARVSARTLADRLKSLTERVMDTAEYDAMTANLAAKAIYLQAQQINPNDPLSSEENIKSILALQRVETNANEAPFRLINMAKDGGVTVDAGNHESDRAELLREIAEKLPD